MNSGPLVLLRVNGKLWSLNSHVIVLFWSLLSACTHSTVSVTLPWNIPPKVPKVTTLSAQCPHKWCSMHSIHKDILFCCKRAHKDRWYRAFECVLNGRTQVLILTPKSPRRTFLCPSSPRWLTIISIQVYSIISRFGHVDGSRLMSIILTYIEMTPARAGLSYEMQCSL